MHAIAHASAGTSARVAFRGGSTSARPTLLLSVTALLPTCELRHVLLLVLASWLCVVPVSTKHVPPRCGHSAPPLPQSAQNALRGGEQRR